MTQVHTTTVAASTRPSVMSVVFQTAALISQTLVKNIHQNHMQELAGFVQNNNQLISVIWA